MENETYIKRLKDRLQIEFKKQDRSEENECNGKKTSHT